MRGRLVLRVEQQGVRHRANSTDYPKRRLRQQPAAVVNPDRQTYLARTRMTARNRASFIIAIVALTAMALALRLPGLFTGFWLDEIWSYTVARDLRSIGDLFTRDEARIDNNHPLNTWFLWVLGDRKEWWIYRVPALVFGVAAVPMAGIILWRHAAPVAALIGAALLGVSFPFVFYSSEARGYSGVVFLALVGFDALDRDVADARSRPTRVLVFNVACVLGFLSHLTFSHFYLAGLFWSALRVRRHTSGVARQLTRLLALHAATIATILLLYFGFVRHLTIGGAAPTNPARIVVNALSLALGGPEDTPLSYAFAGVAACGWLTTVALLGRRRDDRWLFYVLVVVVAPAFLMAYDLVLSARPQPLIVRYFLVAMAFVLIACAEAIAHLLRAGGPPARVGLLVLALAMLAGNIAHLMGFLDHGRGGYQRAVARMLEASSDPVVTVGGDDDFRSGFVLEFYRRRLPAGRDVQYIRREWAHELPPPEWMIATRAIGNTDRPPPRIQTDAGAVYDYDSEHRYSGLSGMTWHLYRIARG
jgi:hypothetical protein